MYGYISIFMYAYIYIYVCVRESVRLWMRVCIQIRRHSIYKKTDLSTYFIFPWGGWLSTSKFTWSLLFLFCVCNAAHSCTRNPCSWLSLMTFVPDRLLYFEIRTHERMQKLGSIGRSVCVHDERVCVCVCLWEPSLTPCPATSFCKPTGPRKSPSPHT